MVQVPYYLAISLTSGMKAFLSLILGRISVQRETNQQEQISNRNKEEKKKNRKKERRTKAKKAILVF